jgi:hypothetical protein
VILLAKSEFGELQILFGAGDFSPQNAYIFGTKVPCSDRYVPRQLPICRGGTLSKTGLPDPYTENHLSVPLVWLHFTGEVLPEMTFILSSLGNAFISSPV